MSNSINFTECIPKLSHSIIDSVKSMGFTQMTPVQASTIPLFLSNKDVLVEAVTGSGKTLAFAIPIIEILLRSSIPLKKYDIGALIIAPTRELATQIFEVFDKLSTNIDIKCTLCVGGTSVNEALEYYDQVSGQILVGTPGRILDMYNRSGQFNFKTIEVLVLDEADTLLDMGFKQSINDILQLVPKQRRTGLFSATQTKEVKELARAGMRNPVSVTVRVQNHSYSMNLSKPILNQTTPCTLQNYYMISEYDQRPNHLYQFILSHRNDKIIVFCSTCACVDYYGFVFRELANDSTLFPNNHVNSVSIDTKLPSQQVYNKNNKNNSNNNSNHPSPFINVTTFHGKMVPKKRKALYKKFLSWESGILFSTDVAARGIDIPDIDWIIQLAAPKDPSFFIHRVGRTARAGRTGGALIYLTEEESAYIELLKGRGVPLQDYLVSNLFLSNPQFPNQSSNSITHPNLLEYFKKLSAKDRTILESGSTAFISFLRAYKESLSSYIFRMECLDIGSVARAYGLLRLPKIPETRGIRGGKPIVFEKSDVDTSKIRYRNQQQEDARIRRQNEKKLQSQNQEKQEKEEEEEEDHSHDNRDHKSVKSMKSMKSNITKKSWVPPEEYVPEEEKRKRKKKLSYSQKFQEEWEELAEEEASYKKYKKGKISSKEYDKSLFGLKDDMKEEEWMDGRTLKKPKRQKNTNDDGNDDDDNNNDSDI